MSAFPASIPALSNAAMRDVETVLHPFTNLLAHRAAGPLVIERGRGVHVFDSAGRDYIEGMGGLWCTALGYGNEEVAEAAAEQIRRLSFGHLFGGKSHEPAIALAEKLKQMAPGAMSKALFVGSGSEANDSQVKLQWYYNNALGRPRKKKIISRIKAYHGVTAMAASLTGLPNNHIDFDLPLPGIVHVGCPHHYRFAHEGESEADFATRLAAELEETILREDPETVAAFIAEPVMGAGGVIVPPESYFEKVQAVLARYDIALIDDEVICGFGRLGMPFGADALGMRPDAVSLAKQLTSGYMPLGAVLVSEPIYQAVAEASGRIGTFGHGFTYGGHPVACAVALKVLEIYERDGVMRKAAARAPHFQTRLRALADHPLVGEARGMGLVGGVELVADKAGKAAFDPRAGIGARAVKFAEAEGVILRPLGDTVAICPPLVIDDAEIDELFGRLARALDRTAGWLAAEGLPS